jgi:hypothetical protein
VGEQCVTKPKGGATYCSAHKPKDSVKSAVKGTKVPKKKEVKKAIDSEFESDEEAPKVQVEPKKSKKEKVVVPKPVIDDDMTSDSDGEPISRAVKYSEAYMDEKEANLDKEKYRKKPNPVTPLVEFDDDLPEPVKPLLKKKIQKGATKSEQYDTDDETLDKNLNLSDDE